MIYSDVYILVSGTITIDRAGADNAAKRLDERNKGAIFTNYEKKDHAKDLDVVMSMYNLIEYSDNYSKTSRSLWEYYRYELAAEIVNFESFKSRLE